MATNDEAANYSIHAKWGEALDRGFVVIPSALLRYQYQLRLNDGEIVVLMNLLMSWWKVNEFPSPQTSTLAKRMNVTTRTVQRHIERLEAKRLIRRIWSVERHNDRRTVTQYDLSGTVAELKRLGATGHQAPPPAAEQPPQAQQDVRSNHAFLNI